jgi:glycosyltransferase involved in cell wall biosynthesis
MIMKQCRLHNIRFVLHVQDIYPESLSLKFPAWLRFILFPLYRIDKKVMRNSNRVIAISQNMKDYLVKTRNLSHDQVEVIENWQKVQISAKPMVSFDRHNYKRVFLFLGNLGPLAGVDTLIRGFVEAGLTDAALLIAGSGSEKKRLQETASGCRQIFFFDVPWDETGNMIAETDVCLLPVKKGGAYFSVPSKLSAYMLMGKPVIVMAENDTDSARVISASGAGWLGPPEDYKWLAAQLKELMYTGDEDLKLFGRKSEEYALLHFNEDIALQKFNGIFNELE